MSLQTGILCVALVGLSAALICPDGGMCEDKNTCCKNPSGGYGCCPLPNAECCSDHLHCCFEGTACDLEHHKCVNRTVSLPWVTRLPAKQPSGGVKAVVCPNPAYECPDDTTCCQIPDGTWGCCPMPKAVCCEDKLHCCPEGTKCDVEHSKCMSATFQSFPAQEKLPARRREASDVGWVTCPGDKTTCPDDNTCCQMPSGDFGCCPFPNAVCCSDGVHCCPVNTVCDLKEGVCRVAETASPLQRQTPALLHQKVQDPDKMVSCPEGRTLRTGGVVPCNDTVACADGYTCCETDEQQWACCPLPEAVCCEDHVHCCPHDTVCNVAASTCDDSSGNAVLPWIPKVPVLPAPAPTGNTKCNDSTQCPGHTTCCKTETGTWACCPLKQAVCCEDHVHCCPHATVCNLEEETCDDPAGVSPPRPWVAKVPALTEEGRSQKCDGETMCPGGTTCCKRTSGQWACCPLPQAVCCDDREHCCPRGYKCNVAAQSCDKPGSLSLPWLRKIPAQVQIQVQVPVRVQAPPRAEVGAPRPARNMCDAQTSCPRDTTCCFMNGAHKWGCCPLADAVCCQDGDHCCPRGHTCDHHRSTCSRGHHVIPWFTKGGALIRPSNAWDVKCDDKTSCASGTTCCRMETGEWGCCPLVKAVCCEDHLHCCPQGYTCHMQSGTCEKKLGDVPLLVRSVPQTRVLPPRRADAGEDGDDREDEDEDVPCGDAGGFRCGKRETCCKTSDTQWGCCPSPEAVCCPDSLHCCPAGYECDPAGEGCSPRRRISWAQRGTPGRL